MSEKIIITAAVCGSRPMKTDNPAVPYTPKEIIEAAVECHKAGAAIAHIHVRHHKTGKPDYRIELFKEVLEGIRKRCDMVVNLTTSGLFIKGQEDDVISKRLEPVYLQPEICSLDVGSVNFSDAAFINSPKWFEAAAKCMKEQGVKPELEVFDTGHIRQAIAFIEKEKKKEREKRLIAEPYLFQLCMGVPWGIEASEKDLLFMKDKLPEGAIWSILGGAQYQRLMITLAMELGGHVRVGFEDNLCIEKDKLARSNAEFVEMAINLALSKGREPATSAEAREILGLRKSDFS